MRCGGIGAACVLASVVSVVTGIESAAAKPPAILVTTPISIYIPDPQVGTEIIPYDGLCSYDEARENAEAENPDPAKNQPPTGLRAGHLGQDFINFAKGITQVQ